MVVAGCAGGGIVDLARQGDLAGLKRELTALSQSRGALAPRVVLQLSRATVARDLRTAKPEQAARLVDLLSPCAKALSSELRERARAKDDAAARATLMLLDSGELSPDTVIGRTRHVAGDAWRAALARALVRPGWGKLRRSFVDDPDERVRRSALKAAGIAKDPDDLSDLLEASRLDPDPKSRQLALTAIGALGGPRVALALRDSWAESDSDTRLGIVNAWAAPRVRSVGGTRELVWAAETQDSREGVAAAAALVRLEPSGTGASKQATGQVPATELRELGHVLVARSIAEGSAPERKYAIELADPQEPLARAALEKAAKDDDKALRVAALSRLLEVESLRSKALQQLREQCARHDDVGRAAREALVKAGDPSVVPLLLAELSAKQEEARATAAEDLVELGQQPLAAISLTDSSPEVRVRAACALASSRE
jgi:HEAT repeat protein